MAWRNFDNKRRDRCNQNIMYGYNNKQCFFPIRHSRREYYSDKFNNYKKNTCGLLTTQVGFEEFVKCETVSDFILKCIKSIHFDMAYTHEKLLSSKIRIPTFPQDVYNKMEKYSKVHKRPINYGTRPGKDVIDIYMKWDRYKNTIYTALEIRKQVKRYQKWLHSEKNEPVFKGQYVTSKWKRAWVLYYDKVLEQMIDNGDCKRWRAHFTERVVEELPLHRARMNVIWKCPVPAVQNNWPSAFDGRDWDYETTDIAEEALFDENGNITI